jgi:hypothetical protein
MEQKHGRCTMPDVMTNTTTTQRSMRLKVVTLAMPLCTPHLRNLSATWWSIVIIDICLRTVGSSHRAPRVCRRS